jgi:hypothetical protein
MSTPITQAPPPTQGDTSIEKVVTREPVPSGTATPHRNSEDQGSGKGDEENPLEYFCKWALSATGVAAAVVFGIWAPLSYKATIDGNNGNDASQSAASDAASSAASLASTAAETQRVMLDAMNSRIEAIGQLWLVDFCDIRTVSTVLHLTLDLKLSRRTMRV